MGEMFILWIFCPVLMSLWQSLPHGSKFILQNISAMQGKLVEQNVCPVKISALQYHRSSNQWGMWSGMK